MGSSFVQRVYFQGVHTMVMSIPQRMKTSRVVSRCASRESDAAWSLASSAFVA